MRRLAVPVDLHAGARIVNALRSNGVVVRTRRGQGGGSHLGGVKGRRPLQAAFV